MSGSSSAPAADARRLPAHAQALLQVDGVPAAGELAPALRAVVQFAGGLRVRPLTEYVQTGLIDCSKYIE